MSKISPCLWFDGEAEEAAALYTSLFPNSRIDRDQPVARRQPERPEGHGPDRRLHARRPVVHRPQRRSGLQVQRGDLVLIDCDDQAEVDRYWDALIADGGEESVCGWLKDRFGVSWQVVPQRLPEMLAQPRSRGAQRAMEAMLKMVKLDVATLREAYEGVPA